MQYLTTLAVVIIVLFAITFYKWKYLAGLGNVQSLIAAFFTTVLYGGVMVIMTSLDFQLGYRILLTVMFSALWMWITSALARRANESAGCSDE